MPRACAHRAVAGAARESSEGLRSRRLAVPQGSKPSSRRRVSDCSVSFADCHRITFRERASLCVGFRGCQAWQDQAQKRADRSWERQRDAQPGGEIQAAPTLRGQRRSAEAIGFVFEGVLEQRDTFFVVPSGKLKLREQAERRWLIHYRRVHSSELELSDYEIVTVAKPAATAGDSARRAGRAGRSPQGAHPADAPECPAPSGQRRGPRRLRRNRSGVSGRRSGRKPIARKSERSLRRSKSLTPTSSKFPISS